MRFNSFVQAASLDDPELAASTLEVAKRAVYRGSGLAVQLPWQLPVSKLILVVDLFGGFGGTPLALFSMGAHFIPLSCDSDPVAAVCLRGFST